MSWITLTPDELNEYLPAAQLKALRTKALAAGQEDPLPAMIAEVATQVRTTLAGAGYALEATPNSFPDVLRTAVAFLTIALAQTRLPGLTLTTEQNAQITAARSLLTRAGNRQLALPAPVTPDTTLKANTSSVRVVQSRDPSDRISGKTLGRL